MAKDPNLYVTDLIDAIRRIETYTKGMTRAGFA